MSTQQRTCGHCGSSISGHGLIKYCSKSCKRKADKLRRRNGDYCSVYWIHEPYHTDPYREGYIGQTVDIGRRKQRHKYNGTLIGERQMTVLHKNLSRREAGLLEMKYRPHKNIGLNERAGEILEL